MTKTVDEILEDIEIAIHNAIRAAVKHEIMLERAGEPSENAMRFVDKRLGEMMRRAADMIQVIERHDCMDHYDDYDICDVCGRDGRE